MPAELIAKRSAIIFNVDPHIYDNEDNEIKGEIMEMNQWTNNQLDHLQRFPASKTIKITFKQAALARKATEKVLLAFSMSIPNH